MKLVQEDSICKKRLHFEDLIIGTAYSFEGSDSLCIKIGSEEYLYVGDGEGGAFSSLCRLGLENLDVKILYLTEIHFRVEK